MVGAWACARVCACVRVCVHVYACACVCPYACVWMCAPVRVAGMVDLTCYFTAGVSRFVLFDTESLTEAQVVLELTK